MPVIRAAQKWQRRPTAAIMGDDWFGHRNPLTGAEMGDRSEYTSWDYSLMNAFQTIEDYTDPKSSLPIWEVEAEWVDVDAEKKINKFQESVERRTRGTKSKPYQPSAGEYFVPKMRSLRKDENGDEIFPTFREWIEEKSKEE